MIDKIYGLEGRALDSVAYAVGIDILLMVGQGMVQTEVLADLFWMIHLVRHDEMSLYRNFGWYFSMILSLVP